VLSGASFVSMGTNHTVVVDDPAALSAAAAIVQSQFHAIDRACSRFKPESELSRLNEHAGETVRLGALLEEALVAAFRAADMTGGLVDPTVGRCIEEAGYTVTFRDLAPDGPPLELRVRRVTGWRSIDHDAGAHTVRIPAGTAIDLGATGKAWAADRAAAGVAERLGVSVVVDCGGDVAVAGPAPSGGWPIHVGATEDDPNGQHVSVFDGGLATSGVTSRRWRRGGVELHHIIDPATGLPAETPWSMVTVAAATCLEANAAATAAVILGEHAVSWLDELGLPARLVRSDGAVTFAGGWSG
jgi:thiamine biosynthesis lipoprotein